MTAELDLCGERVVLLPERALFWPRAEALVVADTHFGKTDAFRAAGVPVPGGAAGTLARLTAALDVTSAKRLIVLGDFWHSRDGRTPEVVAELAAWRAARLRLRIDLVRGNHDRAGPPPDGWGEWPTHERVETPFVWSHFPDPSEVGYVLAGHLHPGLVVAGQGHQRVRLPCFWFGPQVGVLPAFGDFTGAASVPIRPGDRVFVIAEDAVVKVSRG
jgi:DNA ligase-associated metallophosphoesterase